jgi:hypothetical protein
MRLVSALITAGALASLCVSSFAQTAPAPTATQQSSAPAQTTAPASSSPAATPQLKLQDLPPDPHTPTPEEQAAATAARNRMEIQRLAAAQNNWGPAESAPGMSLAIKETGRTKTDAGTQITYQLTGTGFTPEMKLTLVRWALNQNATPVMDGITVDSTGAVICSAPAAGTAAPTATAGTAPCSKTIQPNAPVEITATLAKGEALRVALVAADKKHGAAVSLVPFPIASEDKGCKLQVIRGSKDEELVLVQGDGFGAAPNFNAGTETFGEKRPMGAKPNAQGHFVVAMTPWVTGHDSGDTVIYAQTDTCAPTLSFHWGKDTYKVE